jgi:hypothetical protein
MTDARRSSCGVTPATEDQAQEVYERFDFSVSDVIPAPPMQIYEAWLPGARRHPDNSEAYRRPRQSHKLSRWRMATHLFQSDETLLCKKA